ncbi:DUF2934 domain-containing protein [Sphingomonas sanguinis]|uniref:DUF2934 domain-containing protein n=1 Tax=Sphingomonas sp. LC-1 TaxID=3110957 RepID=UPI0021BAEE5C|nr:DUF2934 domain-containing protein [Sphingomonas sp. LC-1]MCT8002184.1 DUF2934 domain-containing protein [Sphingomonas sp. LC-1]
MEDRDEKLRQRAYDIWQAEGEPHGRDREHWEMAEREFTPASDETSAPVTEDAAKPKAAAPRRKKAVASAPSEAETSEPGAKPKTRKPRVAKPG